jgi:hypothetical protein
MLLVRLTAQDLRTIDGATSPEEISGVVALLRMRVEEARTGKKLGEVGGDLRNKRVAPYLWKEALGDLRPILGGDMTVPPFPETSYYARLNRTLKEYGFTREYTEKLGKYVKEKLRPPYQFSFIINAHHRILKGEFDSQQVVRGPSGKYVPANWLNDKLPD